MKPAGKVRRPWRETQVRLATATVTEFSGPAQDYLVVIAGKRVGAPRVTRQRSTSKGGAR